MSVRACLLLSAAMMVVLSGPAPSSFAAGSASTPEAKAFGDLTNPRDAGIRYGQAVGMAAVCIDMKPTQKAEALPGAFAGPDLEKFTVQADTVLRSWKKTLACAHTADPNPCRLAHQLSCREGYKEIGPGGIVVDGLVEMSKAK